MWLIGGISLWKNTKFQLIISKIIPARAKKTLTVNTTIVWLSLKFSWTKLQFEAGQIFNLKFFRFQLGDLTHAAQYHPGCTIVPQQ